MRTLVLMRGSPGCGKTTWIREHNLTPYALSSDAIREMYASPVLESDGSLAISQRNDKIVWETLFQMLERRMQRGDFTIIDACNSKTSEMTRYRELAEQYRYRIFCLDLTDIPIEEVLRRNQNRERRRVVSEDYIRKVYSRFETQVIPSRIKRILSDEFDSIFAKPFDLSKYDKVVHIGDIHGCYDALQKAFGECPEQGIDPNTAYIFCGDYGDRGADTPKVLRFLINIAEMENVCLLEGNHECHLWEWANDRVSRSREFNERTRFQIETAGIEKVDVRKLYRRFRQCSLYTYRGKTVLCTHGGLSRIDNLPHIDFIPACQMISGVGPYESMEDCAASFEEQPDKSLFQVFGHRNVSDAPSMVQPHSFCLEGGVERGGALRIVTLSDQGWEASAFVSESASAAAETQANHEVQQVSSDEAEVISTLIERMRQSPLILEKKFGHVSSFNFTRAAFMDKRWNALTVTARGLYIDTQNMKIVSRGYEKFFAVNERQDTKLSALQRRFEFPVEVFKKENGFLGLLSYDRATNSLFATTKSAPTGEMAKLFSSMLTDDFKAKALKILTESDVTLLFEVIHPLEDPHIIEYQEPEIVLLDMVDNHLNFSSAPYNPLVSIGAELGVRVKERTKVLTSWSEFLDLYNASQTTLESGVEPYEGYVLRDSRGLMVKLKTDYYTTWKLLRSVADRVFAEGFYKYTGSLTTPLTNYFYAFVRNYYAEHHGKTDIITLRKLFEKSGVMAA